MVFKKAEGMGRRVRSARAKLELARIPSLRPHAAGFPFVGWARL